MNPAPARSRARRLAAAATLALAAAPLAACGGEDLAADELVDVVEQATDAMSTAHLQLEGELQVDGEATPVSTTGYVQVEPRGQTGRLEMKGEQIALVVLGTPYVSTDDELWVRMTDEQFADEVGTGDASRAVTDPLSLVELLAGAVEGGSLEGEDTVDDVDVTHYRVEVDAEDYLAQVAGDGASDEDTLTQELWVDGDGRLSRAELSLGDLGEVTLVLTQHGVERVIQTPASSDTAELES